jgi:hypothetical protein
MTHLFFIWARRLFMILVPILLVFLEWNHPSGFSNDVYHGLMHMPGWWKHLHIAQSFLFGAMAVSGIWLTLYNNTIFGTLSKILIWLFAICYLVFDSTAGIAVGFILDLPKHIPSLDTESIKKIVQALYNDPVIGGSGSFFSLLGSYTWLFGIICAIVAIFMANTRLPLWKLAPPLVLLGISAYALCVGHYAPYGPIAFGAFALASLWFEYFRFGPAKD